MSWILKSRRIQAGGVGATGNGSNNNNISNTSMGTGHNIYSQGNNNLSSSSVSSFSMGHGNGSSNNLSSVSLTLNTTSSSSGYSPSGDHLHLSTSQSSTQLTSTSLQQHHFDAGEDMVRQFAASQLDTQKTAFMRWVNVQLLSSTPSYGPMTSIERDLRDGKRLIALLEVVSQEPLKPEKGNMRIHQMANVDKALTFLKSRTDESLGSIGNEAIVDGNLKLTLGLVWIIIYRFQIQHIANTMADQYRNLGEDLVDGDDTATTTSTTTGKGKKKASSQQVDAKQALLRWVRFQLEDYSDVIPPIQDFHRSWRTGLAFAALIHRHDPDILPEFYSSILTLPFETIDDWRRTLLTAFEVASSKMMIPRLLDPEDLVDVETPDERSIMIFISEYYLVMSKHQRDQDPEAAEAQRRLRIQAKDGRLALAGEDEQARRRRLQEEDERKKREEQEELERIRLKRMEIEGWSLRAAERAREEEEALRKRREEEEERRLQRKLRREQREQEKALLNPSSSGGRRSKAQSTMGSSSVGSLFSESDNEYSDSDTEPMDPLDSLNPLDPLEPLDHLDPLDSPHPLDSPRPLDPLDPLEPMDVKDLEQRQADLDEKLAEYSQGIAELSEWIREQEALFPRTPDTSSTLDRARDLEPLAEFLKVIEEAQAIKENEMSHLHDVREELLEYESPDLAPEQVSDLDKKWWELETIWTTLSNKVVEAKDTAEEVKWILDCSQEIDRVNGEILKFETQLQAAAEKRKNETPQERSQQTALEHQDVNLSSISFLLKTYVDFLTSLMDPKVHHYTAPEYLTALNTELTTVRLPHLGDIIDKARQNLSNDRLLRSFLEAFYLSEAWIGESVEWLANIEVPTFVSQDVWHGGQTVKEYLARDVSKDTDLEFFHNEMEELGNELTEEQGEVNTFRSSGFAKLNEQAEVMMKSLVDTNDITAEATTEVVQGLMQGVMSNLEKVEKLLPTEAVHCEYAKRVLDYLWNADAILEEIENAASAINDWEMRQPDSEVETSVLTAESLLKAEDASLEEDHHESKVIDVVQARHTGLKALVQNLRIFFQEKQDAIHGDRQMRDFLEFTLSCLAALNAIKGKLQKEPAFTGFGLEDSTPLDTFIDLIAKEGQKFVTFEEGELVRYQVAATAVTAMAARSGARQDPAIVHSKLQSVNTIVETLKGLKVDRERDVDIVAGCRNLVANLSSLRDDLLVLKSDLEALEHLEPNQQGHLSELGDRANKLSSQLALLEQDSHYHYLEQDPSCSTLLKTIQDRQKAIQESRERLQARLDVKQQWDMAWSTFSERFSVLQQYLEDTEKQVLDRGIATTDVLSQQDAIWRRSEEMMQDTAVANAEMLSGLEEFKGPRISELVEFSDALREVAERTGGQEHLDSLRKDQLALSQKQQEDLKSSLERLFELNGREKAWLDILRQRHLWSQRLSDSQADVEVLMTSFKDTMTEYTQTLTRCRASSDTSGINHDVAGEWTRQYEHLKGIAAVKKSEGYETALSAHSALMQLVEETTRQQGDSNNANPQHLDAQALKLKDQFQLLERRLEHGSQVATHASVVASYLAKANNVDSALSDLAVELKSESDASASTLERLTQVRGDLEDLEKELLVTLSKEPKATEGILEDDHTSSKAHSELESILRSRQEHTNALNQALEPFLIEFRQLLGYQEGLRGMEVELGPFSEWTTDSSAKLDATSKKVRSIFSSWLDLNSGKDVSTEENQRDQAALKALSSQLESLRSELKDESTLLEIKKQAFLSVKDKIHTALQNATVHSKQLQYSLESTIKATEDRFAELESTMHHTVRQVECHDRRATWEQKVLGAQVSFRNVDSALTDFVSKQAQWRPERGSESLSLSQLDEALSTLAKQMQALDGQTVPEVHKVWSDLCASLVFVDKDMPLLLQDRQDNVSAEHARLKSRIAFGVDLVAQHKTMEAIVRKMTELERLQQQVVERAASALNNENDVSLADLEKVIQSAARDLETLLQSVQYPVDRASEESKARSHESNVAIKNHIASCRDRIESVKQTTEMALYDREVSKKELELKGIQQTQENLIQGKRVQLEKISSLLNWADETSDTVSSLLNHDRFKDHHDHKVYLEDDDTLRNSNMLSTANSTKRSSESTPSIMTLSMSTSTLSASTLTPSLPTTSTLVNAAGHLLPEQDLSSLSQEVLSSIADQVRALRKEIEEKIAHKNLVKNEISTFNSEQQVESLQVSSSSLVPVLNVTLLDDLESRIRQNGDQIARIDSDIVTKLDEFDQRAQAMVSALGEQAHTVAKALEERERLDRELAAQREAERLRLLREQAIQQFELSKEKLLAWTKVHRQDLAQLWSAYGYFNKTEDLAQQPGDQGSETVEELVTFLEAESHRLWDDLSCQESHYQDLRGKLDALFNEPEHKDELGKQSRLIEDAWSAVKTESEGYSSLLNQMNEWSALRRAIQKFDKDGLQVLEKRVEALRWMPWESFQSEEASLLSFIEDLERQYVDLQGRAVAISAKLPSVDLQSSQLAILEANKVFFQEKLATVPGRVESARNQMAIIHETSKEIALHAKFHADLVRIETAIAQQIDAVKARLGSLERSSCFALDSKALENLVVAANEVCMDGKYQFSVLQEVEYSALQQTAFDLDMGGEGDEDSSDPEGHSSSSRSGVQESMERIRQALKQLENYIEEDCFETLLAAKFYTHSKATEDIRQWIAACRDSMAQVNAVNKEKSDYKELTEQKQQSHEWKTTHLAALERRLGQFGETIQHYDALSGEFMLLHHPQTSVLDLSSLAEHNHNMNEDENKSISMRVILRQTVQERTKRTREDWELLKQEFMTKTEEVNGELEIVSATMDGSNGLIRSSSVIKAKTLTRFGSEILEDIARVSREIQEMFDHGSGSHSTLSLAVESDGALIKSKEGQARLGMIESYIRDVLQAKVDKLDSMLSASNEEQQQVSAQAQASNTSPEPSPTNARHHEKMVGVAMQRGLIAESMNRLVESCHQQRREVEETVKVQNAMDLIHETSLLCDSMMKTVQSADSLLQPREGAHNSNSLYNLSAASSSSSLASIMSSSRSPYASPTMSPSSTISRATAARQRRSSRISLSRSFSVSSMSEEEFQDWETKYHGLIQKLEEFTHDIEHGLDTAQTMADRLNDWRLDENIGIATEHWQKVKNAALVKKQELDRVWAKRSGNGGEGNSRNSIHPLELNPISIRPSLLQPTASSNNRVKAILGSPVDATSSVQTRKKRFSTGNIMARGTFVPPSPTPSIGNNNNSNSRSNVSLVAGGRVRAGTAPGSATVGTGSNGPLEMARKFSTVGSPGLQGAMSPTFSNEAKRRPPIIRNNDSNTSISSAVFEPSSPQMKPQRTEYKADPSNALDVEVARVVNASGYAMKVQRLKDGPGAHVVAGSGNVGSNRQRSESTASLILSDNGGHEGAVMDSASSSPRVVKTVRGQARLGGHVKANSISDAGGSSNSSSSGEVGRYVFGDVEPKICYCRILRSRKVMVRVGGGWSELSKFMEDHASLEQRKAKARLLSASTSSISVASHYSGSTSFLNATDSRLSLLAGSTGGGGGGTRHATNHNSSDSLSDEMMSGSGEHNSQHHPLSNTRSRSNTSVAAATADERSTPRIRKKKEVVYHIRPSDDLSLKSIKFVKNGAGEGLVAL
ncbi:actinin alpha 2 [Gryganskiella cystojenkinii]|nr:actinin alpha 2 [Gryganskiella cystojenkinii]